MRATGRGLGDRLDPRHHEALTRRDNLRHDLLDQLRLAREVIRDQPGARQPRLLGDPRIRGTLKAHPGDRRDRRPHDLGPPRGLREAGRPPPPAPRLREELGLLI